jgi:hypothetical protein
VLKTQQKVNLETSKCRAQWQYVALTDTIARYSSYAIQLQLCYCQYFVFQNIENEAWSLLVPETPRTPVAA